MELFSFFFSFFFFFFFFFFFLFFFFFFFFSFFFFFFFFFLFFFFFFFISYIQYNYKLPKEEKLFNNGVILTKKFENIGIGGNILHLPTENTIKNKGIFIIESNLSKNEWKAFNDNQGAVLQKQDNGTYKLLNADTLTSGTTINDAILAHGVVKDMSDETEINLTNTTDNMFVNDKSLTLNLGNKITGKTITAVSQNAGNTILNNDTDGDKISGNLHLTLDNTTIVGIF